MVRTNKKKKKGRGKNARQLRQQQQNNNTPGKTTAAAPATPVEAGAGAGAAIMKLEQEVESLGEKNDELVERLIAATNTASSEEVEDTNDIGCNTVDLAFAEAAGGKFLAAKAKANVEKLAIEAARAKVVGTERSVVAAAKEAAVKELTLVAECLVMAGTTLAAELAAVSGTDSTFSSIASTADKKEKKHTTEGVSIDGTMDEYGGVNPSKNTAAGTYVDADAMDEDDDAARTITSVLATANGRGGVEEEDKQNTQEGASIDGTMDEYGGGDPHKDSAVGTTAGAMYEEVDAAIPASSLQQAVGSGKKKEPPRMAHGDPVVNTDVNSMGMEDLDTPSSSTPVAADDNVPASSINTDNDDDDDDEKKPGASSSSSLSASSSSSSSGIANNSNGFRIQQEEKTLKEIFASYDMEFDNFKEDRCISDGLLKKLIAKENDGSCVHGSTRGRYHISRTLEVLLSLAHSQSDNDVPLLTAAVERLAGVTWENVKADPDFAQFLVSTVTNLIRIDYCLEGSNVHFFCTTFLSKAIEIKHKLYLDAAIINNGEELYDGLRHLYGHKLLKYKRDTTSYRGVLNICYRETKNNCDCMKRLWFLVGKPFDKRRSCSGCRELFPKKELPYCRGCAFHQYCSYECSVRKCWVGQDQKQTCTMRDYIRCSTCRLIFPSDELSVHTCIFNDDVIL